jgi:hypothetical protein
MAKCPLKIRKNVKCILCGSYLLRDKDGKFEDTYSFKCSNKKCKIRCNVYIHKIANSIDIGWYILKKNRKVRLDV